MSNGWMFEKIDYIPKYNFIYKMVCFFIGHKLSYMEYYALLYNLNKKKLGDKAKIKSINKVLDIYKHFHNNNLPQ